MTDRALARVKTQEELPAICIISITFSSLANAAAPEITKKVPVYILSWISRLKKDSGELIKNMGHMKVVGVNTKELMKLLRRLSAWELC